MPCVGSGVVLFYLSFDRDVIRKTFFAHATISSTTGSTLALRLTAGLLKSRKPDVCSDTSIWQIGLKPGIGYHSKIKRYADKARSGALCLIFARRLVAVLWVSLGMFQMRRNFETHVCGTLKYLAISWSESPRSTNVSKLFFGLGPNARACFFRKFGNILVREAFGIFGITWPDESFRVRLFFKSIIAVLLFKIQGGFTVLASTITSIIGSIYFSNLRSKAKSFLCC